MNKGQSKKAVVKSEPIPDSEIQNVEELEITTASSWKKDNLNIRKIKLPSGAVFKVKTVSLINMATQGFIPLPLLTKITEKFGNIGKSKKAAEKVAAKLKDDDLKGMDSIMRKMALLAVIEPNLTEDGGSDESIDINDIDFYDLLFVFQECVRGGGQAFAGFF